LLEVLRNEMYVMLCYVMGWGGIVQFLYVNVLMC